MKKYLIIITVFTILLSGCSLSLGEDGDAYIAYSWVSVSKLYTDDPSFGDTIRSERYEPATTGTWYFEYSSSGEFWYGNYTVYKNGGAFIFTGDDLYFKLFLYGCGPTLFKSTETYSRGRRADEYSETLSRGGYTVELNAKKRQ